MTPLRYGARTKPFLQSALPFLRIFTRGRSLPHAVSLCLFPHVGPRVPLVCAERPHEKSKATAGPQLGLREFPSRVLPRLSCTSPVTLLWQGTKQRPGLRLQGLQLIAQ